MWINKTHVWARCLEQESSAFASSGHLPCALLQVFPTLPCQVHCPSPRLAPLSKASSHSKSSWRTCHAVSQPATLVLPAPPRGSCWARRHPRCCRSSSSSPAPAVGQSCLQVDCVFPFSSSTFYSAQSVRGVIKLCQNKEQSPCPRNRPRKRSE